LKPLNGVATLALRRWTRKGLFARRTWLSARRLVDFSPNSWSRLRIVRTVPIVVADSLAGAALTVK
jgi:hypothetical protein